MNPYRGFTPEQRMRALHWLKVEIAAGRRPPTPARCDACGQTRGVLEWHSEDYSEPFGPHIGAYGLCYPCHMAVHCAVKNPESWAFYTGLIRAGQRSRPFFIRSFPAFARGFLDVQHRGSVGGRVEEAVGSRLEVLIALRQGHRFPP